MSAACRDCGEYALRFRALMPDEHVEQFLVPCRGYNDIRHVRRVMK
jgi:hypothetical protein